MNFTEALAYIHSTKRFGSRFGLKTITELLRRLGNPHKNLKFIHIAGTNGKGSTVAFLSSILITAGYKTGVFTSPYIQRFNERIKVGDDEIADSCIATLTSRVKAHIDAMLADGSAHPTEFEILTAMALLYFEQAKCDIVLLEVGLGGRLDSTNVIDCPLLAVITALSLDHMEYLGERLEDIAFEKAGIIKPLGHVLLYPQEKAAKEIIKNTCVEKSAVLRIADFSSLAPVSANFDEQRFSLDGYGELAIKLLGAHQQKNAALAVLAASILREKGFTISEADLKTGLLNARWPGRFEITNKEPIVIIDGAHNEQGWQTLADNLAAYFPGKKITFIAGVLADKNYKSMIAHTMPLAKHFKTITPDSPRALDAKALAAFLNSQTGVPIADPCDNVRQALDKTLSQSTLDEIICVFGSLYFLGEVRDFFGLA